MSSVYRTGSKNEILSALPIIQNLAKDTLQPSELQEAENLALMFTGNKRLKKQAIVILVSKVKPS
jgi:hypothetical protein